MGKNLLTGFMVVALLSLVALTGRQAISDDEDEGYGRRGAEGVMIAPVTDDLYRQECGSCHFAYQPGWLPAESWRTMMGGLADHFGENAEVASDVQRQLTDYLTANAADAVSGRRSRQILRSLQKDTAPLRISELPYIVRKHHELSPRMVKNNPKVNSLSQCDTCHTRADAGVFDEDGVTIPGFPEWDD